MLQQTQFPFGRLTQANPSNSMINIITILFITGIAIFIIIKHNSQLKNHDNRKIQL